MLYTRLTPLLNTMSTHMPDSNYPKTAVTNMEPQVKAQHCYPASLYVLSHFASIPVDRGCVIQLKQRLATTSITPIPPPKGLRLIAPQGFRASSLANRFNSSPCRPHRSFPSPGQHEAFLSRIRILGSASYLILFFLFLILFSLPYFFEPGFLLLLGCDVERNPGPHCGVCCRALREVRPSLPVRSVAHFAVARLLAAV